MRTLNATMSGRWERLLSLNTEIGVYRETIVFGIAKSVSTHQESGNGTRTEVGVGLRVSENCLTLPQLCNPRNGDPVVEHTKRN